MVERVGLLNLCYFIIAVGSNPTAPAIIFLRRSSLIRLKQWFVKPEIAGSSPVFFSLLVVVVIFLRGVFRNNEI